MTGVPVGAGPAALTARRRRGVRLLHKALPTVLSVASGRGEQRDMALGPVREHPRGRTPNPASFDEALSYLVSRAAGG
jgi:hypothetical protein